MGYLRDYASMKAVFYAIALTSSAGSSQEQTSEQELITRAIESAVQLPAGAHLFEEYSRNYATLPDGKVIGIYVLPWTTEAPPDDVGCEVALIKRGSRPCTDVEMAEIAAQEKATAKLFGLANQTRWFDDYRELPMVLDGGCDLIEIIFDPQSHLIQRAQCSGAL